MLHRQNDVNLLRPVVRDICIAVEKDIAEQNLPFKRFETYRSDELQQHYVDTTSGAAPVGYSYHRYGLAFDFVGVDSNGNWTWNKSYDEWMKLKAICEKYGMYAGANWGDYPHYQFSPWVTVAEALENKEEFDKIGYYPENNSDIYIDWFMSEGIVTKEKDWHNTSPTWYEYIVTMNRIFKILEKRFKTWLNEIDTNK